MNNKNKNTIDKNTNTSDKEIKTLIENQRRAQNWLGKWYWQIQIDKMWNRINKAAVANSVSKTMPNP
jgi:hypothetical protein